MKFEQRPSAKFKAVIFDMDGVLCDSEPLICEAACRMFAQNHRVKVLPEDFIPFTGTGENRYIGGVAEKYGIPLDLSRDKASLYSNYFDLIRGRLGPLVGVPEFIKQCRERGIKMAVATSADRIKLDANLNEIGFPLEIFDVCVTGSEVERKKPDPEAFLVAANKLGINSEDCLVIEDAENGIRAAKAAGCRALGITGTYTDKQLRNAGADWVLPNLQRAGEIVFL